MLGELYEEDLIGDPRTLEEEEEQQIGGALFFEDEAGENDVPNVGDDENDVESQALPQSNDVVKPKQKRVTKNPLPKLDAERLKGPRGIAILENVFADYKFGGKGSEKEDLDQIMKRVEHWAHRLFPKYQFDDCLQKIETLGHKKPVMTYIKKIRMGLETADSASIDPKEPGTDLVENDIDIAVPADPFDELLTQQISEAHAATARSSPKDTYDQSSPQNSDNPSSPLRPPKIILTAEHRERMERNKQIARERLLARMKKQQSENISTTPVATSEVSSFDQDRSASTLNDKTPDKEPVSHEINVSSSEPCSSVSLCRTSLGGNENENTVSDLQKMNSSGESTLPCSEQLLLVLNLNNTVESNENQDLTVHDNQNVDASKIINDAIESDAVSSTYSPPEQISVDEGEDVAKPQNNEFMASVLQEEGKITEINS